MYMAGGDNITISQDGNSLTFIGMDNIGATTFRGGVSTGGNTLGTTGTVNNQIVFVGGNNITLSQSANANSATVTISGPNIAGAQTGISGISVTDTLYTSGTVHFTGSNIVTLRSSGAGQTIIVDATVPAQTAQTGISSIVASDATYTSGQVIFTGAGAVTVSSGANQSVIINAPVQSVQPEGTVAFGVSSGGNTVGSTGMASGTGPRLVFVGGNNITLSQSLDAGSVSGTITISAGASGAGGIAASLSGNSTSGGAGYSLVSSGTLILAGGNNITLSQDGASVTISGANVGGAQTGISGISGSDTVYTSGTVKFTGSNIVTVRSGTGQAIVIDASQSVQTWNVLSASGNTSGTLTSYTSGTVVLIGGNNITLSQSSNSITISGAEGGGAGISTYGNTAGTTGIAGEQLILVGGSNITLSQSIDAGSSNATVTIVGASGGGALSGGFSTNGNTSGDTGLVTGRLVLAGGNNITLSGSTDAGSITVTISGPNAGGAQTGISSIVASDATYTSGQVIFSGTNNITVLSGTGQNVIISGPSGGGAGMGSQGNTAGTSGTVGRELWFVGGSNISLSQSVNGSSATLTINGATAGGGQTAISGIVASDATYTSGTVSFVGSGIVTVESGTGQQVIINASAAGGGFTAGVSSEGNTDGTTGLVPAQIVFVGGSNVTLSQSINASSATITINGPLIPDPPAPISFGVSSLGNTSGDTGLVSNQMVLVGGNNVTLSQATDASGITVTISAPNTSAQSEQTWNVLSADGNTSGTLTSFTSGTIVFAGGNNITLSQSSNSITISGANVGGAQTGISGISASDTVYTSGTVKFTGSNNITVLSGTGQAVIISGPTGGGAGMTTLGNTAGTAGTVGRELLIVGGSNISLSQSINGGSATLTIDGASGGGAGFTAGVSSEGNTSGTTGLVPGQIVFVGGNNVTLSQSINASSATITISAPNTVAQSAESQSFGMSSLGNTAGTTGIASGAQVQFLFAGGNNITLSQSVDGASGTITISAFTQSVQPEGVVTVGMSNLGNTSGTSGVVNGSNLQYYFAGGNNVTLSQSIDGSSATLTISGANVGGAQTGISGIAGSGASTATSGTVQFANSNGVTFGLNGNTITAAHNGITSQSNQDLVFYATSNTVSSSAGTINASSIILRGLDQLSVGISNGSLLFEAGGADAGSQSIGISNLGNTSGTSGIASGSAIRYYFAGGNNVTLSQSIDGASGTVTISAISVPSSSAYAANVSNVSSAGSKTAQFALADHAHVGVAGINASGTASTFVGNVMLSGTNLTLVTGGNSSAGSIGLSVAAQTVQTQGSVQVNGSTGAISFNAGANMSLSTVASNLTFINLLSSSAIAQPVSNVSSAGTQASRYALADHAHVGVAGLNVSGTASTWVGNVMLSVTNLTLVTGGNSSAGSIGISAAAPGGAGPAVGVTNTGNTAGNLFTASNGSVYVQATNNITASASTAAGASTIWLSGPTGGGAGMGTGTNTSGTSGTVGRQLYFYANSNVTLSQSVDGSSASLSINAGGGGGNQTIGMSNVGNTSGDTTPVTGPAVRVVFAGGNNVTLSQSTNGSSATVTISAGAAGGATVSEWMPPGVGYSSFTQMGQSSLVVFPVSPPYYVTATQANLWASISLSTSSNSSHDGRISLHVGVYTKNASTLSLASSGSVSHSWNVTGSTSSGSIAGWRALTVPIQVYMTPGQYWVGVISATATTNANWFTASNMGLIAVPAAFSGPLGATNNTNQFLLGAGVWSAQSAALPASVAFSHITATSASTARPILNFLNQTV